RLLTQTPPAAEETVRAAAQSANWTLPRLLAAVVAAESETPNEDIDAIAARLARRIGTGTLGAAVGTLGVVLLGDPEGPGRRKALESALAGERASLGPAVPRQ